jgi:hypothetical protein
MESDCVRTLKAPLRAEELHRSGLILITTNKRSKKSIVYFYSIWSFIRDLLSLKNLNGLQQLFHHGSDLILNTFHGFIDENSGTLR